MSEAIRALGTNALPTLARRLRAKDSLLKRKLIDLCDTYPVVVLVPAEAHYESSLEACRILGPTASPLLPERDYLGSVAREKGKFRSFLLASMNHFLAKEWNRAHRQKRGGGCVIVSLQDDSAENRYGQEPAADSAPDQLFERRWAMTLLDGAMARLRQEFHAAGKSSLFDALKGFISGGRTDESYADVASRVNLTEGAVKVAVHRLRKRYGKILRQEIAQTVSGPEAVEEEIQYLFQVLGA